MDSNVQVARNSGSSLAARLSGLGYEDDVLVRLRMCYSSSVIQFLSPPLPPPPLERRVRESGPCNDNERAPNIGQGGSGCGQ